MQPTLVYREQVLPAETFERQWRQSAATLQGAGVKDGDVVALLMRNSPLAVELMVATRHLGAQWCPINWHFLPGEVQYVLANSGARVLVADDALLSALNGLDTTGVQVWTSTQWLALRDATPPSTQPAAPARGAMFYTSGTPPVGPRASCASRWVPNRPWPRPRCAAWPMVWMPTCGRC